MPSYLDGTAFFSASAGLVVTGTVLPPFPYGGVMFVGHNLDSEEAFRRRLKSGHPHGGPERPMRTWSNLYHLLATADVPVSQCFFTNAYVGLKAGATPTGRFPGALDPDFRAWCRRFLRMQIEVMQPTVVATLGTDARRFVATMSPELAAWLPATNPEPTVRTVRLGGKLVTAVALLHPSGHHASLSRRRYGDSMGIEAEALLLRDAIERSPRLREDG